MYPSSFSTCAMEILSLEEGTPTTVFPTIWALRMRVNMSAMGSVMLMREASYQLALMRPGISPRSAISRSLLRPSPNLRNTPRGRPVSLQRLRSRTGEAFLGNCCCFSRASWRSSSERLAAFMVAVDQGEFGHDDPSGLEWKVKGCEQGARLVVGFRGGRDADVEPPENVDLVVFDFRKDDLLLDAKAVVAAAVECAARDAAEVTDTRDRHGDQTIEELVHALAAQGHHAPDRKPLADLERRDRFLGFRDHGFLPGDLGEIGDRVVQDFLVRRRLAHAHIESDLLDAGHLHRGLVPELLHQIGHHVLAVVVL